MGWDGARIQREFCDFDDGLTDNVVGAKHIEIDLFHVRNITILELVCNHAAARVVHTAPVLLALSEPTVKDTVTKACGQAQALFSQGMLSAKPRERVFCLGVINPIASMTAWNKCRAPLEQNAHMTLPSHGYALSLTTVLIVAFVLWVLRPPGLSATRRDGRMQLHVVRVLIISLVAGLLVLASPHIVWGAKRLRKITSADTSQQQP